MKIEVAFATPEKQVCIPVRVEHPICIEEAINQSGIINHFSKEIDLSSIKVGIFGKVCKLDKLVSEGDRIEIYRQLLINPMDARRNRAGKSDYKKAR
jgi:putative ubiquitin-RnfH superfamily antitoxin RatB of RatAB toxin-antitoxin module